MAARTPGGPRCLEPVRHYALQRPLDELDPAWRNAAEDSVCWRPEDHPPGRHTGKASYLRMLARARRRYRAVMSGRDGRPRS
jgi:hypothetical protein